LLETLKNSRLNIDLQSVSESLAYTGAGVMPYIGDRIHDLEVPLMYVTGSEDRKYAKIGRELTTGKGNIQLEIFSEASHAAHIEKPLEFIKVLRTFLKTIQGGL
jgi:2-succinyl-6-hydroxy-2,4-cyclohexadiene-1-carboxylate synthase